jgi:uncharacterized protein (DUF1015 family)
VSAGARVEPFRALLYDLKVAGGAASLVAPPYDLIGRERQNELYARSSYNIVRLEFGREADRYGAAQRTLDEWLRSGVLKRADRPAIYCYRQSFDFDGRSFVRSGFITRFRLEEFGASARVFPHERTFPSAKEDRLRLLTAIKTNTSSIFGLYLGKHPTLACAQDDAASRDPIISVRDDSGILNEVYAIEDPGETQKIQLALADATILIADGHHRYETALNYRRARRAEENPSTPQPYDFTLMTLVASDDPGLVILPTHRLVTTLDASAVSEFKNRAQQAFDVASIASADALRAWLGARRRDALAVALKGGGFYGLTLRDRAALDAALPGVPLEVRELDVSILHALVFDRIFGLKADAIRKGGSIEYTIDARRALTAVAEGRADGAFLMSPPSIGDVERVSLAGATMPEKSTYFFPKLLTGLVLNPVFD